MAVKHDNMAVIIGKGDNMAVIIGKRIQTSHQHDKMAVPDKMAVSN